LGAISRGNQDLRAKANRTDSKLQHLFLTGLTRAAIKGTGVVNAPGESVEVLTLVPEYNDPLRFGA
jgi:hypothetical protein